MKFEGNFFSSPVGQIVLVAALVLFAGGAIFMQRQRRQTALPPATASAPASLPRTILREGERLKMTPPPEPVAASAPSPGQEMAPKVTPVEPGPQLPLSLLQVAASPDTPPPEAPFGRLVPCETVLAIESTRLETPVVALVTEDIWQGGKLVIPAGAEVHGRASADRVRERLAAEGSWTIVWRRGPENGRELTVRGVALDRDRDSVSGAWGVHDGSAGLRGEVLRTSDWREVQLFAATFLTAATAALQETRSGTGILGETASPATTARNAALSGTGAVLREYAGQIREAIARDGFYLRIPAGKAFYLYITEAIEPGRSRSGAISSSHAN